MFGLFGSRNKTAPIDSLIGAGTTIDGDVRFRGGLRIDGVVKGKVLGQSDQTTMLVLSEHGRVEGDIRAAKVVINGEVTVSVIAAECAELMPKARVAGDLHYKRLEIREGAVVTGRLLHEEPSETGNIVDLKSHNHGA